MRASAEAPTTRPSRWFLPVTGLVATAVVGVIAFAVYRQLSVPGQPVLPSSWCRVGAGGALPPLLGSALLTRWTLDPIALAVLAAMLFWYLAAARSARRRNGAPWPVGRTLSFSAGILVGALATNSSIAVYDMALFSAHMTGHLMLVMLAPVLLCAGDPLRLLVEATGEPWRSRVEKILNGRIATLVFCPPVALATYAAVIVGSHLTGLMDTVMTRAWAGQLEHLVYLLVGLQFFTLIVGDAPIRWRLTTPARWILLALSMSVDTFTGVVLLMSVRPVMMTMVPGLDVNALSDTHTGGAIMWVGGDGLMALVMIVLAFGWLRRPQTRAGEADSWTEAARRRTFEEHTGAPAALGRAGDVNGFDDDDVNRARYNEWLASLAGRETGAR